VDLYQRTGQKVAENPDILREAKREVLLLRSSVRMGNIVRLETIE
jgi:hypothetical protein